MNNIVFFDGICNLCNSSVNFIIDHDTKRVFKFTALQSKFSQKFFYSPLQHFKYFSNSGIISLTEDQQNLFTKLNSILYLEDDIFYMKSDAVLQIARNLDGFLKYLYWLKIIPRPIRDFIYDWIAKNRYSWFGKKESCRIPTPELKSRFID